MDNEKHGINIDEFKFRRDELDKIGKSLFGTNWPVVYVLNNEEEAYVGETLDAKNRMHQHLDNPARGDLKEVHVISDDDFNKSVILDLEAFLIAKEIAKNPKRRQREAAKAMKTSGVGTKSQQALQMQREEMKTERKHDSIERRLAEQERKFELRQQKRKEKHKGH